MFSSSHSTILFFNLIPCYSHSTCAWGGGRDTSYEQKHMDNGHRILDEALRDVTTSYIYLFLDKIQF